MFNVQWSYGHDDDDDNNDDDNDGDGDDDTSSECVEPIKFIEKGGHVFMFERFEI